MRKCGKIQTGLVHDAFKGVTRDVVRLCEKGEFHGSETRKRDYMLVLDTPTIELFLHFDGPFLRHNRMRFDHKVVEYGRP